MFFRVENVKCLRPLCSVWHNMNVLCELNMVALLFNIVVVGAIVLVVSVVDGGGETPGPFPNPVS